MQQWILMSNSYYLYRFFNESKEDGLFDTDWTLENFGQMYEEEIMHIMDGGNNTASDFACIAAIEFRDTNVEDAVNYCDFCPFNLTVCGPDKSSLFKQYSKMMNWNIPKLFEGIKNPTYDGFRILGVVRRFSEICLNYAFASVDPAAYKYYNIDWGKGEKIG
jgi:hypothetical protein